MNAAQNLTAEDSAEESTLLAVAVPVIAPLLAVETDEPKHQRRQSVQINVRFEERELDQVTQLKLHTLRAEIHALGRSLRERNQTITRLRHEVRLRDRVLRLKTEARIDARVALEALKTGVGG